MSKVEVDLNQLAAAVSAAILQFAQPPSTKTEIVAEPSSIDIANQYVSEKPKKRGRPKKEKPVVEESYDIVEQTPIPPSNDFTAPAKRPDFVIEHDPDRKMAKRIAFKKKKRANGFNDNLTMAKGDLVDGKGNKLVYPEHAPPREEQVEQKWRCENCGRDFMAFPSYIPPLIEGHQPAVRCYNCNTK